MHISPPARAEKTRESIFQLRMITTVHAGRTFQREKSVKIVVFIIKCSLEDFSMERNRISGGARGKHQHCVEGKKKRDETINPFGAKMTDRG